MKILRLLIVLCMLLDAKEYTLKLYETLLSPLFTDFPIVVYADEESVKKLQKSDVFEVERQCNTDVDLLIGSRFAHLPKQCRNKPLFATTYKAYRANNNAFGAFYWRKGRPQIHFKKEALEKFGLKLPPKLQRFVDE